GRGGGSNLPLLCLEQVPGIGGVQAVLVDVAAIKCCVLANRGVAPQQVHPAQRAGLQRVADVGVTGPAGVTGGDALVDVAAAHVAGHEVQTGNAQTLEVVVIAGLPGTFVPGVEVDHLHRVGQVDRVVRIIKAGITAHALVGDREVVEARPQGNRQRRSVVVEIVTGGAVIRGLVVGQIGGQAQVVVQLGGVGDAGK